MPPKRKRAASSAKAAATSDAPGRDAPSGNATGTVDTDVTDSRNMDPPAKRTRASSSAAANGKKAAVEKAASASTTPSSHRVSMPVNGTAEGQGEHGEGGKMRMPAPPPAGSVDPVGYKTNPPPKGRPVRVYADGVFDLMHLGHMRVLQQAKTAFPDTYLIVGVTGDKETHKRKGLTVMSAVERAESVRHLRWVDEVIEDCPWILDVDFLEKHNIDYVAHDDLPYASAEGDDVYKEIKERGMFLVTQRTEGVSTTGIITKIVRDYEQYVARQLKRGTKRQELNISWLKKNELDIKRHVAELRDTIRTNWSTTGQEVSRELRQFWQPSRPNSPAPSVTPSIRNGIAGGSVNGRDSLTPALDRLARENTRSSTPQKGRGGNLDFAAGYAMGLIGGVKGWMEGSRRRNLSDSRAQSPNDSPDRSPIDESEAEGSVRGRQRGVKEESEMESVEKIADSLQHS